MTSPLPARRLLDVKEVAAKLGYGRKWFDQHRLRLEQDNFPKACLGNDQYGHARWDEAAIDLWLDSKIDPSLLNLRKSAPVFANSDTSHLLKQRAESLAL